MTVDSATIKATTGLLFKNIQLVNVGPIRKVPRTSRKTSPQLVEIAGLHGVRVVEVNGASILELRHALEMSREGFGRLVNVSVRAIAEVETKKHPVEKLQRNYVEVKRLCDSLRDVVNPSALGPWFNAPNPAFGGLKPIEVVERGEIDRLWEMDFRLRSGIPF